MPKQATIHSTTQEFLDIYDITNNVILLKDGSASMVLSVNAMNFGLLAEQEQDAIIYTYAALLNSINYPVQILIQSQTKDATVYLDLLKKQEEKALSQNKKQRIARYRTFVSQLIKDRNVLDKKFYVVVSASSLEMGLLPMSTVLPGTKAPDVSTIEKTLFLERAQTILEPRRDHLLGQFNRIGLFARQMSTQEIIQIFYINYNPEAAEGQQITDSNNYTTPLVKASTNGGFMNTQPAQQAAQTQPTQEPTPAVATTPPATSAPAAPATQPAVTPTPSIDLTPVAPTAPVDQASPQAPQPTPDVTETITPLNTPQGTTTPGIEPAPTAETTPVTPAPESNPSAATTPATPQPQTEVEKNAQNAINSTLKEIAPGQELAAQTPQTTPNPTASTQAPPTVNPVPATGSNPENKPADKNNLPPLPEI